MTDNTATGRRLGARSPRLETNGTSSRAPISTTGKTRMMNVSADGRAQRQEGKQPPERPIGLRIRAEQRGLGQCARALRSGDRRQHDDDDDGQRREKSVLQHRLAEEGDALFFSSFSYSSWIGPRIDGLPRYRRRADPALEHQPEMHRQEGQQQAGDDEDVQGEEPAQGVGPDDGTAQQQVDDVRSQHRHAAGHRRADAHAPVGVGIPSQDLAGEGHAQRHEQQEHAREPVQLARVLEGPVQEDLGHVDHDHHDHGRAGPVVQRSQEPAERLLVVQVDQALDKPGPRSARTPTPGRSR